MLKIDAFNIFNDIKIDFGKCLLFFPHRSSSFPTLATHSQLFDGIKYLDLPIINVKTTSNNTVISLTNGNGKYQLDCEYSVSVLMFHLQSCFTVPN